MTNRTSLSGNRAVSGHSFVTDDGQVTYVLPAPLGRWLPGVVECTGADCAGQWIANLSAFDGESFPPPCEA